MPAQASTASRQGSAFASTAAKPTSHGRSRRRLLNILCRSELDYDDPDDGLCNTDERRHHVIACILFNACEMTFCLIVASKVSASGWHDQQPQQRPDQQQTQRERPQAKLLSKVRQRRLCCAHRSHRSHRWRMRLPAVHIYGLLLDLMPGCIAGHGQRTRRPRPPHNRCQQLTGCYNGW
jgi:hypothetical protein